MADKRSGAQPGRLGLSRDAWQMLSCGMSEFIGTGILCFLGCMGTLPGPLGSITHFQAALTFGFVVALVIATFGHVSGAHINPAVTLGTVIAGILTVKMAVVYVVAQCLGAILGFGLLKLITPCDLLSHGIPPEIGACSTVPHKDLNLFQAVSAEFLATSILIMLCCAVWDPRNAKNTDCVSIKFGILVAAMALAEGPYTGASMNPARSLGPAVWNNVWTAHWIYWVGPLLGATVVTYTWRVLFLEIPTAVPEDQDADMPLTSVSSSNEKATRNA